jgi:hypothetical protein
MMILRQIIGGTAVVATLAAAAGIFEHTAHAGWRGRRCTTTLCFDGSCCYSNPPYSNGNPYESGSGNFWGFHHYCRQYGFVCANRCNSPCGPGNTAPMAGTVIAPRPAATPAPSPSPPLAPTVEPNQPPAPPTPKPVE